MKNLFIIILFFGLFSKLAMSQDFEPSQSKFFINGDSVYVSPDSALFSQSKLLLGWHIIPEESSNMIDNAIYVPEFEIIGDRPLILRKMNAYLNGMGMILEPTATINTSDDFEPRWNSNPYK